MMEQPLSITNVLRNANHDFVNHLHLIRMNLDLGRVEEAIDIIKEVSDNYRVLSNVNQLQLPKTIEWLHTCRWRFSALQISVHSEISKPLSSVMDEALEQYLEKTVIHIYDDLDPFTEQKLIINIESNEKIFKLKFELYGLWDTIGFQEVENDKFNVQTIEETNSSWIYVLSKNQE